MGTVNFFCRELEKQRQSEWEAQKISEMQQQRQREQENVLKLKSQNQSLSVELSTFNEKIKELSQKICDTRVGVSNVKSTIDGMRTTRDTQMSDMGQLKAKVKDQNQRLVQLSQEKAKLDSKNKSGDSDSQMQFSNKQVSNWFKIAIDDAVLFELTLFADNYSAVER